MFVRMIIGFDVKMIIGFDVKMVIVFDVKMIIGFDVVGWVEGRMGNRVDNFVNI